jgi:dephospho-CoA kinase
MLLSIVFLLFVISITSRFQKSNFDRLKLSSLIFHDRKKLKKLIMIKMNQIFKENQERIVIYQSNRLFINNMIKYLHFHIKFYIENVNTKYSLNINSSFEKSIKSTTNSKILRLFCEIAKNETKNKQWKSTKRVNKIRASNICYLTLFDKKSRKKNTFDYHLTNKYESQITIFKI